MQFIALWIGVLIFGLGAIFSLLSAIRTLQISRRWSDYRLRRRYIMQARGSVLLSVLSGALAIALLIFGRMWQQTESPASLPATQAPSATASPVPPVSPTQTSMPPEDTPTVLVSTPSPIIPPTSAATATPAMPIAVQAMIQGTMTPSFYVQFGRLRFSTEINNYTLIAPGEKFRNPIKQMYSVFTYQPLGVKVEWTALWYQNDELKYVDTTSWKEFPPGVAVATWQRPAPEWRAGEYEVQIFVGTEWKASGGFLLEGEPPTVTASPLPTATASLTPTATASPLPPPTRTLPPSSTPASTSTPRPAPTSTPVPSSTSTHVPTLTLAPKPTTTPAPRIAATATATRTPAATATPTAAPTAVPTRTPPPTATSTSTATRTPRPTATPVPSSTPSKTPSRTPSRTPTPSITPTLLPVSINVYFTNTRRSGTQNPPFDQAVSREIPGSANAISSALDAYFVGPTIEEQASGLVVVRNGFVSYRRMEFTNGVLSVYLAGNCQPTGTGYSLAQPLIATLKQFPGVLHVKLYDAYDHTADASSTSDSRPDCLDVIFTSTATPLPTETPTSTPSKTPVPSPVPTRTLVPTATQTPSPSPTPVPTRTPLPSATASPRPTHTPLPTATYTPPPTNTPIPTATTTPPPSATPTRTLTRTPTVMPTASRTRAPTSTSTPRPTLTPTKTYTPAPTNTPRPTLTLTPINAPTRAIITTPQASATAAVTGSPTPTLDVACNRAEFLGDVTIVDNATLRPGEAFRKTWRIQNAGNCPWTGAYKLVFFRGDHMGGPDSIPLPALIVSGQAADVSVDLIAPASPGQYEGYWQIQTPGGTTFGIGPAAAGHLWVKIRVAGQTQPTTTASTSSALGTPARPTGWAEATITAFVGTATADAALAASPTTQVRSMPIAEADLASNACEAQWQANDGTLECPSQDGDPRGSIVILSQANLEDGTTVSQPALLTIPSSSQDGYILGLYPQYQVQAGDRLQALVGCEHNAELCSVLFRVSYLDATGAAHDLWTLGEFYDGHYYNLDLDLSALAGQQVRFVLSVNDLGNSTGDRALWVAPRIVRLPAPGPTGRPSPSSTPAATSTAAPTPTVVFVPPTPTVPVQTPAAPIPQFFDSLIDFFRQLFGTP